MLHLSSSHRPEGRFLGRLLVSHHFSEADVTDVAVTAVLLVIPVPDMAGTPSLIGTHYVFVISLVAVVGFIVLLRVVLLMSWLAALLLLLLLLVLRQSLL